MNNYILADHLLQFGLNALIGFSLFTLLVEGSIRLFKIHNFRLQSILRLIPPLKLIIEPILWFLPSSAAFVNASLFSCSHPIQKFLYSYLSEGSQRELNLHGLKTVSGHLLLQAPHSLIEIGLISLAIIGLGKIGHFVVQYWKAFSDYRAIRKGARSHLRPIFNLKLIEQLKRNKTKIFFSKEIEIPLAGWRNSILFPEVLSKELTQNEFEAVIAHELAHLRWHDSLTRLILQTISTLYWWVPMKHWLKKVEQGQELASDLSVHQYDLHPFDLASALHKTIQKKEQTNLQCAAFAKRGKNLLLKRFEVVLNPSKIRKQNKVLATLAVLIVLGSLLALGFAIC